MGVAIALAASVVGVLVWSPRGGWPDWYTFLWTPALLLVTLRGPRWATITGIALVAGSSAALVTWGAELAGRVQVAQRDVARLGNEPDPLAVPLLERFGESLRRSAPPETASAMYALWRGSSLGSQGYPGPSRALVRGGALVDELDARLARPAAVAAVDDGARPRAHRLASGHAGSAGPRRALRPSGALSPATRS